jgi:peptidoglycan/xylan/chitin deacetylase (PgdA/CDA1 family)
MKTHEKNKGPFFGKNKALTLSYDDGARSDIRLIESLNSHGIKCTVNLNGGLFAPDDGAWRLSASEAKRLYRGHEIALHGYKHLNVSELTNDGIRAEFADDKRVLEDIFGVEIRGAAYAYGVYTDAAAKILTELGIRYCRTVKQTCGFRPSADWLFMETTCHQKNERLDEITERFIAYRGDEPAVFSLWGHSFEFDRDGNWDILERFCKKLGGRSDIAYLTCIEAYDCINSPRFVGSDAP